MSGSRAGGTAGLVASVLGLALAACSAISYQGPPGAQPIPVPASPRDVLRAVLPPGDAGEVLLDAGDGLSPDEAALMAVDQNPRLAAVRTQRRLGEAQLVAAGVLPNPRFDGSLDFPVGGADATALGYGVGVSWNVSPLLSRSRRMTAARENLVSVDLDVAWQEWQVAQAARLHVMRSVYLERRLVLAGDILQTWQRRVSALDDARRAGLASQRDLLVAERSLRDAEVSRLDLERQLESERGELNRTLGVDATRRVALDTSFTVPDTVPSSEGLLAALSETRLDLIALQHAHASHDASLRAAALARFPPVSLGVHSGRDVDRAASVGLVVSFEFPFFDRGQAEVSRESALEAQVDAEYDARLFEARSDVVRTVAELDVVASQLAAAREEAEVAARLADEVPSVTARGALDPMIAEETLERSFDGRLRVLELEQSLAELRVALAVASGSYLR